MYYFAKHLDRKNIKKILNIGFIIVGMVMIMIMVAFLILQSTSVQNFLTRKFAAYLSDKYQTSITIQGVSVSFFDKLILKDVLIKDQKHDSLIYVKEIIASVDTFSMKKLFIGFDNLKFDKALIYAQSDSLGRANYQFLLDKFEKKDTIANDSINIDFFIKKFELARSKIQYNYHDSIENKQIILDDIGLCLSDIRFVKDLISLEITNFSINNRKGLILEDLTTKLEITHDSIFLRKLKLHTPNSTLAESNFLIDKSKIGPDLNLNKLKFNIDLQKSVISFLDIAQLVPSLQGMDEKIEVSGQISGNLTDLKGKNMELHFGQHTQLSFDFYLSGLPEITNTYMQFDLKQSYSDFNDFRKVKLPGNITFQHYNLPEALYQAGIVQYKGNFTGFISDFVAFGTFGSKWGVLNTDLSFVPSDGDELKIEGSLKTVSFRLGEVFQTSLLDRVTFNGKILGQLNQHNRNFDATVSGTIDSMMINQYQYKNIKLNGDILNKKFDGSLVVDDPNLKLMFAGAFDLNVPVPLFNFEMLVEKADLKALKITNKYKISETSFSMNANFSGSNIDNLSGGIHFKEGLYRNENGEIAFNNFDLKTFSDDLPVLQVRSDFLDGEIKGHYQLQNLYSSVKEIISRYLPSAGLTIPSQKTNNNFAFKFVFHDMNRFVQVLYPEWKIEPATLSGSINSQEDKLILHADFPSIQYQTTVFHNYSIVVESSDRLNIKNSLGEILIGEKYKISNLSLNSEASNDVLDSKFSWNQQKKDANSGSIQTSTRFFRQKNFPHIETEVIPTQFSMADTIWQINRSLINVDSTMIKVDKFRISNKGQSIMVNGSIAPGQIDKMNIFFNQIELRDLNRLIPGNLALKGQLNGNFSVFDVYDRALFLADLKIDSMSLLGETLGEAKIQSSWDKTAEAIGISLLIDSNQKQTLKASGFYHPGKDSISADASFDQFSIMILQPLMGSSFTKFHGSASGKVHIYGPSGHIKHDGALFAENAGLSLTELQVNYTMNDSVLFSGDKIIFPDMDIEDDYKNRGVFSGSIQHQTFSKMVYDLTIKSNRIMAINTTPAINEQFYGKTFGSGLVRITGKGATVLIDGIARTEKGTDMNISLDYQGDVEEYSFLSYVPPANQPNQVKQIRPVSTSNLQMKFNIEVTPEAKAQLIYNSKIGDMIRSQGSGNLQLIIDNNNNITLYGAYTVEQGDYLFTLKNVINKKFEIQQGGTIEWNGDPYDAMLNLNAIYRLKASLSDLMVSSSSNNTDYSQRIPVLCKINLTNSLNNPDILFDIELPSTADRLTDELRQFISSEEDMNKQILSLLVLGKFYTPEYMRGSEAYQGSNNSLVGSTASTGSELLSNQLSNWLSQISKDFDIGFNYRPGNDITNDEIEVALSTQMFNDRVSINGNIGNNASQRTSSNTNSLVGDGNISVKLTRNGKLQLKGYNHANNNLIYETAPYTQGVGISYKEDFNDFEHLWQKIKSIFRKQPSQNKTK